MTYLFAVLLNRLSYLQIKGIFFRKPSTLIGERTVFFMYMSVRGSYLSATVALLCAFALCLGGTTSYAQSCETVREEVLRLHVIANSDSEKDQFVKLLVRDRLLEVGASCFRNAENANDALNAVTACKAQLTQAANDVLLANAMPYTAEIEIRNEYFDTRTYEHTTLPAGVYLAVRVVLGQGTGKNWWCVMFPPLCLPAVTHDATDGFLEANGDVLEAQDGYEVRFKIVEWYESLRQKIKEFREK